jgi:pimeloyl-ACP methyl ester carboxylesterase
MLLSYFISKSHLSVHNLIMPVLLSILILIGNVFLSGCQNENAATPQDKPSPALVSATLISNFKPADINRRIGDIPGVSLFTRYPVSVYKIVYRTQGVKGNEIQASGALVIPQTNTASPLLSIQHGTITSDASAPSNYGKNSEVYSFGTVLGSNGFVVVAPDYIGYGASKDQPHPYEHRASLASASLDMLRAVKEFCQGKNVQLNEQLFLAGYSEGGYATMSLHKLIEDTASDEFTVTASAPGAGAYHKSAFAQQILNSDQALSFINTYLWVLQTYNTVYNINKPYSFFLNEPYASQVAKTGVQTKVNEYPKKLFTASFREGILSKQNTEFLAAFADNDVYDWKPKAPIALFHGTADDFVPFFNSQQAFDAMRANGATQVELIPIKDGNHFTSVASYTLGMFEYFNRYREVPE